jgi:hypothetical protein
MRLRMLFASYATCVMAATGSATAYTIDCSQLTPGQHLVINTTDGWTATANPTSFDTKGTLTWYQGAGVQGKTPGEIDVNESIRFVFDTPQIIRDFTLTLLFAQGTLARGPYGDPNETALIRANDGTLAYSLTATGPVTANWTGQGTYAFLGTNATQEGDAGAWQVINPFGDLAVTSLDFSAFHNLNATTNDSDYAFDSLNTVSPVPEPATLVLFITGPAGLSLARRMTRNYQR